jgi:DNA-binding transcriptional ArsR family regulator
MLDLDHLALLHEHLTALTRPNALAVLSALAEQAMTVDQLTQSLHISGTQLNQALMALRKARMITLQKQEQHFVYMISQEQVRQLLQQLNQIYQ